MTKRFTNVNEDIFQYGEWYCSAKSEHCADVIATAMNELIEENEQLKSDNKCYVKRYSELFEGYIACKKENEQLKQQKPFLKIIDDYFIQYEDGELFNLHKPSDIRCLMYILNRGNGYGELECEYNDLGKGDVE